MNLVGKIFVVLILVASTVFMTMGLMVYATHQNWYDLVMNKGEGGKPPGYKVTLENARGELRTLNNDIETLKGQLAAEKAAKVQALQKSETERKILAERNDTLVTENKDQATRLDTANKTLQVAQDNLTALRKENGDLREQIRLAFKSVDDQLKLATGFEDKLHILGGQYGDLKKRADQLAIDFATAIETLKRVRPDVSWKAPALPPTIRGQILAIDKEDRAEISLGSDDGLEVGNTLEVYRENKYLGKMQVLEAHPHRAVGMILKEFKQDVIRSGDEVATRLKA